MEIEREMRMSVKKDDDMLHRGDNNNLLHAHKAEHKANTQTHIHTEAATHTHTHA